MIFAAPIPTPLLLQRIRDTGIGIGCFWGVKITTGWTVIDKISSIPHNFGRDYSCLQWFSDSISNVSLSHYKQCTCMHAIDVLLLDWDTCRCYLTCWSQLQGSVRCFLLLYIWFGTYYVCAFYFEIQSGIMFWADASREPYCFWNG